MNVVYTASAKQDLEQAFNWYENQLLGLGKQFLHQVEQVIKRMVHFPEIYPCVYQFESQCFRRAILKQFPYVMFYTIELDEIVIHAVFDSRQFPNRYFMKEE